MQVGIIQSIEGLNRLLRTVRQRKGGYVLCLSWDIHLLLPPDTGTPGSWAFSDQDFHHQQPPLPPHPTPSWFLGLWVRTGTAPLAFLGRQLADGRSWDFSASIKCKCQSFIINFFLCIYIYILLVLFLQRTLTNTVLYKHYICLVYSEHSVNIS